MHEVIPPLRPKKRTFGRDDRPPYLGERRRILYHYPSLQLKLHDSQNNGSLLALIHRSAYEVNVMIVII